MQYGKWIGGGAVGAAIGAAIWVAIGYFTGYEIGWIAWGVGALAGMGVKMAAGDEQGWAPGIVAAVCGLIGIVAGKFIVFKLVVSKVAAELGVSAGELDRAVSFSSTLSPWDLLWVGLAIFTAFQLGSGMAGND